MNPDQPQNQSQATGLPLPQSQPPAGGYSFAAPPPANPSATSESANPTMVTAITRESVVPIPPITATAANMSESDDTDEVDEAWLDKAREIVERTKEDPYMQTVALARLRADFLKTRYDVNSKMNEDAAK